MGRTLFLCALLSLGFAVPRPAAGAGCTLAKVAEMPVVMSGLTPLVSVKVQGVDGTVIADSGAFYSTLTPAGARKFGLKVNPAPEGVGMVGITGEARTGVARAAQFQLIGMSLKDVDFLVVESNLNGIADGLLGQNLLTLTDMEYDLNNGVIRFFSTKGDCSKTALAYWAQGGAFSAMDIYGMKSEANQIEGEVKVNGVSLRAILDTGAGHSILTSRGARLAGVKVGDAGVIPGGSVGGVGHGYIDTWIAPVKSFEVGDEQINNTRLRFGDADLGEGVDMLLGADFFLSHRVFLAKDQNRLYFTYNGGAVFRLDDTDGATQASAAPASGPAPDTPKDASAYARRGAAFAGRHQFSQALDDLTKAIELDPNDPDALFARGQVRMQTGELHGAEADFTASLNLRPGQTEALMSRGEVRLSLRDEGGAKADFDSLLKLEPEELIDVGFLYKSAGFYQDAIAAYDARLTGHLKDDERAEALNDRCSARVDWGQELDKALDDCDHALAIAWSAYTVLDERGLVRLRQSRWDLALTDFNAALHANSKAALGLYGRAVAEARKGQKSQSEADLAAAKALDPELSARMTKLGITP